MSLREDGEARDLLRSSNDVSTLITGKVAEFVKSQGVDIEAIGNARVKLYQQGSKDADGNVQKQDLISVILDPKWADGPAWPVVQPAKPTIIRQAKGPTGKKATDYKVAMVLPDMQIGYYRGPNGELIATHDELAMAVLLQMIRAIRPDRIIHVGDNEDLPEMGKYRLSPAFQLTTQASIDRGELWCAQVRAAAGDECDIDWIEGNHELRLSNYILDNAAAAFGIKVGNRPESWPVMSIPHLLDMDRHGINYVAGYPASKVWINERLKVVHGYHVKSNGSTAHAYLANERVSVIYGHIHRREWAELTREGYEGPNRILAMSPGCLARVDGAVPSTKGGMDLDGRPITVIENWQQGVTVVRYKDGQGRFVPEQVPIDNGWTVYHGQEFQASLEAS